MSGKRAIQTGDVVADRYRVERVIGRGAMGVVVAAANEGGSARVAIKSLLPNALGNAEAIARFEREARAAGALKSQHAVRVIEVGRASDGAPFIVMELLEGADLLAELHRRGGRLPYPEAASYIVQACEAVAEAHALGIIHRDLKPSNLFLAKQPNGAAIVKILDYGISKASGLGAAPAALTGTADLIGSPLYMSPEQIRSPKNVDPRSDEWSLAATLYELIAGKPPFDGKSMADLSANILMTPAPDLRAHDPSLPAGLAGVLSRALEKSPDRRFASVEAFARALSEFTKPIAAQSVRTKTAPMSAVPAAPSTPRSVATPISNKTLPLAPPSAPSTPRMESAPRMESSSLPPAPPTERFPWWVVAAIVALVAVVVGLVVSR